MGIAQPFTLGGLPASARLDWSRTDRYDASFSADPRRVQDGFHDLALRVSLDLTGGVGIELAVRNLLGDEVAANEPVLNFFNDASYQSYLEELRRFMLTLRMSS